MIDEVRPEARLEHAFGKRHADGGAQSLSERTRCRLDAERMSIFRMAGSLRVKLAEALDLLDGHALRPGQIKEGIEQHRAVSGREHETVAIGPGGIGGIE